MNQLCSRCDNHISNNRHLTCSQCRKSYHLEPCIKISEKLFNIMGTDKKRNWKCMYCTLALKTPQSCEFVTHRRKSKPNVSVHNSFHSLSIEDDSESEEELSQSDNPLLTRSCPDLRLNLLEIKIKEMEKTIASLNERLNIADNEIVNLLSENCTLKKQMIGYNNRVENLKEICRSSTKKRISNKIPKSSKRTKLDFDQDKDISLIHTYQTVTSPGQTKQQCASSTPEPRPGVVPDKNRIHIVSTNKKNRMLDITKEMLQFEQNFNLCHYLLPGRGLKDLLCGLDAKLKDFSHRDFCVIFIGDEDFKVTKNVNELVQFTRETLIRFNYTNVLICLPTYKLSYYNDFMLYNHRVEIFNNIMYNDVIKHEYAYVFDTNSYLDHSDAMFDRITGSVNDSGLCTFVAYLNVGIDLIKKWSENNLLFKTHKTTVEKKFTDNAFTLNNNLNTKISKESQKKISDYFLKSNKSKTFFRT